MREDYCASPFRLFCDDLWPDNVLVDPQSYTVTAVIDWEFTYAAPAEFTYTAPWWLLMERPEEWESDLNEFLIRYTPRLRLFLEVLRAVEDTQIRNGTLSELQRLSHKMAKSMENGLFWVCLAARYSSLFDEVYWAFLDSSYYGPFTGLKDRIALLTEEEQEHLEGLVQNKKAQASKSTLEIHCEIDEMIEL